MSKVAEEIRRKLLEMTSSSDAIMIGEVKSVDVDEATMEVDVDGSTFHDVRLKSIIDSEAKGIKVLPKQDSIVLVSRLGKSNELFVVMYSEVDSILWEIEDMKLFVDKDGFVFNDGNNKGMVKLPELVQKLNNLENAFNQHLAKYNSHIHPGGTIGGSTGVATVLDTNTLTTTTENDLENTKVKH
jgi:hypothetical protein